MFLQQRWLYSWVAVPPATPWTINEQSNFHKRADQNIWSAWSNRAKLSVSGSSPFALGFAKSGLPINLDIRRVSAGQHWTVFVTKVPPGAFAVSSVQWKARRINLDTNDFVTRNICSAPPKALCTSQIPVAHEFGHAAGNTAVLARGDEYRSTSPHAGDQASIMHSGSQLRARHFRTILDEMNTMIPGATFAVLSV